MVLDVPLTPEEAFAFYERELRAQGWTLEPPNVAGPRGFLPGGFGPAPTPSGAFASGEGEPWLTVTAGRNRRDPNGPADVRLLIDAVNARPSAQPYWRDNPAARLIPALHVPEGVVLLRYGGGGGGQDQYATNAAAETEMGAGELAAHLDRQLEAVGWRRAGAADNDTLAWSAWDVPAPSPLGDAATAGRGGVGAGRWQGLLLVWATAGDRRLSLSLRVELVAPSS